MRSISVGVQFFCLIHLLNAHLIEITPSTGSSMLPTLAMDGDYLLHLRLPFAKSLQDFKNRFNSQSIGSGIGTGDGDEKGLGKGMQSTHGEQGKFNKKVDQSVGTGLKIGDLVVSKSPTHPQLLVCKRVLGLPGDTILVDPRFENSKSRFKTSSLGFSEEGNQGLDGNSKENENRVGDETLQIGNGNGNGNQQAEEEIKHITIPQGHVFLCGDNLANSTDSRHYGPVPLGLVRGKVIARVSWKGVRNR